MPHLVNQTAGNWLSLLRTRGGLHPHGNTFRAKLHGALNHPHFQSNAKNFTLFMSGANRLRNDIAHSVAREVRADYGAGVGMPRSPPQIHPGTTRLYR